MACSQTRRRVVTHTAPMTTAKMSVAIAGGGIGGLTAAIALRRAGLSVDVYEQAPKIERVGAGLALWPNAIHVLDHLGIGAALRQRAVRFDAALNAADGTVLIRQPASLLHDRYDAPTVAVPRWYLQESLLDHLGSDHVHLGKVCDGYRQDSHGVDLRFTDGTQAHADLLIGADGVKSAVRQQMLADGPARYRGDTAWRAIIPAPDDLRPVRAGFETFGPGPRFGMVPAHDDTVVWFATDDRPEGERDGQHVRDELLATFGRWHDPIPRLIAATEPGMIVRNDIYDRRVSRRWVDGRVALLGDAAHPIGPDGGQGACQAIEDAETLADALTTATTPQEGLLAYQKRRRRRIASVARQVAMMSRLGRIRQPALCAVRDKAIAAVPDRLVVRQLDGLLNT